MNGEIRFGEFFNGVSRRNSDHSHSSGTRRLDPNVRVFEDNAAFRHTINSLSGNEEHLWIGLPVADVFGSDDSLEELGQADHPE